MLGARRYLTDVRLNKRACGTLITLDSGTLLTKVAYLRGKYTQNHRKFKLERLHLRASDIYFAYEKTVLMHPRFQHNHICNIPFKNLKNFENPKFIGS